MTATGNSSGSLPMLTDAFLTDSDVDLLEHGALARALARAIRSTNSVRPLGIALYGPWGQGKSTIARLLEGEFAAEKKDRSYLFVRVDAWKYGHERGDRLPLRRHFLLAAYREAGLEDEYLELRRSFRQATTARLFNPHAKHWLRNLQTKLTARFSRSWRVAITLLVTFFGLFFVSDLRAAGRWFWSLIGAFLVVVAFRLFGLIRDGLFITTKEDPSWSVEEFDERLNYLLENAVDARKKKVERFVFVIDDLDRCDDSVVVEAIETLQAFFGRERCVYIVTADEMQLKRAVRLGSQGPARALSIENPIPPDETFLEKVFQVRSFVPRPSPEALERYGEDVAKQTLLQGFKEKDRESVLRYLIHPLVSSPRQVRVILNDYALTYAQAQERESEPRAHLRAGSLTDDKLLFAKIVVLRAHFPWFYELLLDNPGLLLSWQEYVEDRLDPTAKEAKAAKHLVISAAARASLETKTFVEKGGHSELAASSPAASTVDPTSGDSLEAQVPTAGHLIEALRMYLVRTKVTRPKDASQVQEFLYLRSREEFANLHGSTGDRYRRAVANGDEEELVRLVAEDPEQAVGAAQLAIAKASADRPVEGPAARTALLALLPIMSSEEVTEIGQDAANVLYSSDSAQRLVEAETRESHAALVPWMPAEILLGQCASSALVNQVELDAITERVIKLRCEEAWETLVARASSSEETSSLLLRTLGSRPAETSVFLITPTISGVRPIFEGAAEWFTGSVSVVSVEDSWMDAQEQRPDGSSGESTSFYLPAELGLDLDSLDPQEVVDLLAHRDIEDDWVVDTLTDVLGNSSSMDAPRQTTPEECARATKVLDVLWERTRDAPLDDWISLASIDFGASADAVSAAKRVVEGVQNRDIRDPGACASIFDACPTRRALPAVELSALEALLRLPPEVARQRAEVLALAVINVVQDHEDAELTTLSEALAQRSEPLIEGGFDTGISDQTMTEISPEKLRRVALFALAPVNAGTAAAWLVRAIAWTTGKLVEATEDESRDLELENRLKLMAALAEVVEVDQHITRTPVLNLPLDGSVDQRYALRILRLRERVHALSLVLPTAVVEACAANQGGLNIAVRHALRVRRLTEPLLFTVLTAVSQRPTISNALRTEIQTLMRKGESFVSVLDQVAYIAVNGYRWQVGQVARLSGISPPVDFLVGAREVLHDEMPRARSRLKAAEKWAGEPSARLSSMVEYRRLLAAVATEEEFETVLASMIAFYPVSRHVPEVRNLRRAFVGCIERLGSLRENATRAVVDQFLTQFRLQRSNETSLTRLVDRIFAS